MKVQIWCWIIDKVNYIWIKWSEERKWFDMKMYMWCTQVTADTSYITQRNWCVYSCVFVLKQHLRLDAMLEKLEGVRAYVHGPSYWGVNDLFSFYRETFLLNSITGHICLDLDLCSLAFCNFSYLKGDLVKLVKTSPSAANHLSRCIWLLNLTFKRASCKGIKNMTDECWFSKTCFVQVLHHRRVWVCEREMGRDI